MPNYAGTKCVACPLGAAGRGGKCDECGPGEYAPAEGSLECVSCPKGYASDITETPADYMMGYQYGLFKCTQCPDWALSRETGLPFCDWCPPGEMPDEATRTSCVAINKGPIHKFEESWGKVTIVDWSNQKSDAFCPLANRSELTGCLYSSDTVDRQSCPMTCPENLQWEIDDKNNVPPPYWCTDSGCFPWYPPVRSICGITNVEDQQRCNQLLCMGSMRQMQGGMLIKDGQCDDQNKITDCTCEENLREACNGGVRRLREDQCRRQCTVEWCNMMCEDAAASEGGFLWIPGQSENPFTLQSCQARGEKCEAICQNDQRRVVKQGQCGRYSIKRDGGWMVPNDALCGGTYDAADVCLSGRFRLTHGDDYFDLYQPERCSAFQSFTSTWAMVPLLTLISYL
mmetsp:Transcript_87061/g.154000  ORF Transcript_87061/g.154000 Transcript_87061/m.154000 type:complete len:400 (-) Transcript_87061:169-1368(-)